MGKETGWLEGVYRDARMNRDREEGSRERVGLAKDG